MSKFNSVISDSINRNTNLTKVRIKIDPAKWNPKCNVHELDEYTGYILQEFDDGTVSVFIPGIDDAESIFNLPNDGVEHDDRYSDLKQLIVTCLKNKGVQEDDIIAGVEQATCIHVLEDWMRHGGMSEREIIDILKEFISESR